MTKTLKVGKGLAKFKAGDKVNIISVDKDGSKKIGRSGTIMRHEPSNVFPYVVSVSGDEWYFHGDELELDDSVAENSTINEPKKYDDNKPMMHLVRPEFVKGLAEGLTYGALKYDEKRGSEPNYLRGEGFQYSKIMDSLERHINAFKAGESIDPESNVHHLLLAGVNTMFLYMYEVSEKGVDDRYIMTPKKKV